MNRSCRTGSALALLATALMNAGCSAPPPIAASSPALTRAELEARLPGCYALFDRRWLPASDSLYGASAFARLDPGGLSEKIETVPSRREMANNGWWVE